MGSATKKKMLINLTQIRALGTMIDLRHLLNKEHKMLKKLHWPPSHSNNCRRMTEGVLVCHRDPRTNLTTLRNINFLPSMNSGVDVTRVQNLTAHQGVLQQLRVNS